MKRLQDWIATGKVAQFVAGSLDAGTHAQIFEAAKTNAEVRGAIASAKEQLMTHLLGQMQQQDPQALIASGKLLAYATGLLGDEERQFVELMAMAHPQVSIAMDAIKRQMIAERIQKVQAMDPDELIASSLLMDFVLGECTETEQLDVELAAAHFPSVAEELEILRSIHAQLMVSGAVMPPAASKDRFSAFMEQAAMPADGWSLVMPPLNPASKPSDFAAWVDRVNPESIHPEANLNAFPIDANRDMLTLFVVLKEGLETETHLFDVEKFLVLEGSCYVEMHAEKVFLNPGDYFSVPKFTPHTVVVTSDTPCKLIVQQIAA